MPARVTLEVTQGKLTGQQFVFEERTMCIIGRKNDCQVQIPNDPQHSKISRHHCLLDINPPDVRVRDFGSLNGTYVNGRRIGKRKKDQSPEDARGEKFPEYDLKDGDEIQLCDTVFRVGIRLPVLCAYCSAEIPEGQQQARTGGTLVCLCEACRKKAEMLRARRSPRKTALEDQKVCAKCGRDVTGEAGTNRQGDYVCAACRDDPFALLRSLLQMATTGDQMLAAIEGYEAVKELGRGGMGAVYLAKNTRTNVEVALKIMLPQVAASESATERFLREIDNTKILRHPNVVRLYDSGCSRGTFFFTLEFCNGGSVDKLLCHQGGTIPTNQAISIILQVLDALDYAHQVEVPRVQLKDGKVGRGCGLVHRDLKPSNIFLSRSGGSVTAKVGDYGLAKAFDLAGLSGHTCTGAVAGTAQFMPRQQVLEFRESKPEVDVWAAAASLYCMLTGCSPRDFPKGPDPWAIVLETQAVPIRQRNSAIPSRLAQVIDEALVDKPEIRIKTARDLKRALKGAI